MVNLPWRTELFGDFPSEPMLDEAVRILCDYRAEAERFDRSLPHVRGPGGSALVVEPRDRLNSQRNAAQLRRWATEALDRASIDAETRQRARRIVSNMTDDAAAELAGASLPPLRGRQA